MKFNFLVMLGLLFTTSSQSAIDNSLKGEAQNQLMIGMTPQEASTSLIKNGYREIVLGKYSKDGSFLLFWTDKKNNKIIGLKEWSNKK